MSSVGWLKETVCLIFFITTCYSGLLSSATCRHCVVKVKKRELIIVQDQRNLSLTKFEKKC